MSEKIEKEIKYLVSKIIEIPVNKIDINVDIFRDMGVDSLRAIEIVAAVEKKYRITVSQKELVKIRTLAQIIRLIKNVKKTKI